MFETIQSYLTAYERRDLDACMSCMAPDDRVMAFGTNAEEKRVGRGEIRGQFKQDWTLSSSASIKALWHHEVEHGDFGWVATDLQFCFQTSRGVEESAGRATFVMVRDKEGRWLIEHMHFSVPTDIGGTNVS